MRIVVLTRALAETRAFAETHAYVSIADSDQAPADLPVGDATVDVLRLAFDDVLDGDRRGRDIVAFSAADARTILDFVASMEDRVETLVIHCNGGRCRSPAVAAALDKISIGDDDVWFRTKTPNNLVYRTILETHVLGAEPEAPRFAF